MLRIGIIGCGKIAQVRHIPEYAANSNCELAGFYDLALSRAEEMAQKYGGKAYTSAEELLAVCQALKKALVYTQSNVSPAAVCGWLAWTLR